MKFETLVEKILNEEHSDMLDARKIVASVGWVAHDGIVDDLPGFEEIMDEEEFEEWNEAQGVEQVSFAKGAKEVMEYAKEYGANASDLKELKSKLLKLGKDYQGKVFVLYGIEADLSLGVI